MRRTALLAFFAGPEAPALVSHDSRASELSHQICLRDRLSGLLQILEQLDIQADNVFGALIVGGEAIKVCSATRSRMSSRGE
jgi:hypothetical protein